MQLEALKCRNPEPLGPKPYGLRVEGLGFRVWVPRWAISPYIPHNQPYKGPF